MEGMAQRSWYPAGVVDARLVLAPHGRGRGDPAFRVTGDGAVWRTCRSPEGPGTLRVMARPGAAVVEASAWGPGAQWLLDTVPALLGGDDDPQDFEPVHQALHRAVTRLPGLRIGRTQRVFEALVPAVLEQKVTGLEARRAWRALLRWYGEPAPGPAPEGMRVMPVPEVWKRIPSWEWHRAGVEAKRARVVTAAAHAATRLEETLGLPPSEVRRRLCSLPGIGAWTAAEVMQRAHGDADAVSVGDYHLPGIVGWALTGKLADDGRMLELLAPYAGHRHRAARLIELCGPHPPRRGPRTAPRDFRFV